MATDLAKIHDSHKFTWGPIIHFHEIGDFVVLEYHQRPMGNSKPLPEGDDGIRFHGFIDGQDVHESWFTLDQALVGLIARKYDGYNSRAAQYIGNMIGMTDTKGN